MGGSGPHPDLEPVAPSQEGAPEAAQAETADKLVDEASPDGDVALDSVVEPVESELEAARRERDEFLDLLRRERAEFENFRRRSTRERMEALDRGAEQLAAQLLGVVDNFAYVLQAADESADTQLAKGAQMVHDELWRTLSQAGLEEIPGVGEPFDPTWHEAMMQVPADEGVEPSTVVDVLRRGYRFKGRVLRPASVSVAQ